MKNNNIKIGLALGGGASLGFAHIGVIKVLEENGIKPDFIAGTSMGSIIGSMYAYGYTPEKMTEILESFDFKKIRDLRPFTFMRDGLFSTEKLVKFIDDLTDSCNIEDLKIPFQCNAVDMLTSKEYIFKSGKVSEAIQASCAIPGIFKPVKKDGMLLFDGGVVNNLPYNLVKDMGADIVIAVDVLPVFIKKQKIDNIVQILFTTFDIMQRKHETERMYRNQSKLDCLISIPSKESVMDFSKAIIEKAIQQGEKVAKVRIGIIKKKIELASELKKLNEN